MKLRLTHNPIEVYRWNGWGGESFILRYRGWTWMFSRWSNKGLALNTIKGYPNIMESEGQWSKRSLILPANGLIKEGVDTPCAVEDPYEQMTILFMAQPGFEHTDTDKGTKMAMGRLIIPGGGEPITLNEVWIRPTQPWEKPFFNRVNGIRYWSGGLNEFSAVWTGKEHLIFADAFSKEHGVLSHKLVRISCPNVAIPQSEPSISQVVFRSKELPEEWGKESPHQFSVTRHPSGKLFLALLCQQPKYITQILPAYTSSACYMVSEDEGLSWKWGGRLFGIEELGFKRVGMANKFGGPQILFNKDGTLFEVTCDGHPEHRVTQGRRLYAGKGVVEE